MAQIHAMGGTTTIIPTTLTSSDRELRAALDVFAQAKEKLYPGPAFWVSIWKVLIFCISSGEPKIPLSEIRTTGVS